MYTLYTKLWQFHQSYDAIITVNGKSKRSAKIVKLEDQNATVEQKFMVTLDQWMIMGIRMRIKMIISPKVYL